jgi:hypothetical protein
MCETRTKGMTVKDFLIFLPDHQKAELDKMPEPERQATAEERVFHSAYRPLLRGSLDRIVLAGIAENILKDQGVNPSDYFDMELIRTAVRRQIRYIDKLCTLPDRKDKDEELLEELNKSIGVESNKKYWLDLRERERRSHPIRRWQPLFCLSPVFEDVAVKAVLAHVLVRESCTKGYYHGKGLGLAQIDRSAFAVYEIEGYHGDKAALEGFFNAITKNGVILEGGVETLIESFRKVSPAMTFRAYLKFGPELIRQIAHPSVGVLQETSPGCYRIIGWHERAKVDGKSSDLKNRDDASVNLYAYTAAAADYCPQVEVHSKQVYFSRGFTMGLLRQDAIYLVAMETFKGNYVKKDYPAELFDAFREARAKRDTYTVRASLATASNDAKLAGELVERLMADSKIPGPALIQERYRHMADQLAKQFKLNREKSTP